MSHDGQGVGTLPICARLAHVWSTEKERLTKRALPSSTKGLVVKCSHMKALVDPSSTEAMRPCMSLLTKPVVVKFCSKRELILCRRTLELKITRRPALLKSHNVCHSLATAVRDFRIANNTKGAKVDSPPRAGDTECGPFQALDVLKLRVNPGDNCPSSRVVSKSK